MNILGLDLGTKTGWCDGAGFGTWRLATAAEVTAAARLRMDRRLDPRFRTLRLHLEAAYQRLGRQLDWVVFEDVQFSSTTQQTQLWSTWRAAVWGFALDHDIRTECVPVTTLKKFATGSGGASKDQMAQALVKKSPADFNFSVAEAQLRFRGLVADDNAVDAIHIYHWAKQHLKTT